MREGSALLMVKRGEESERKGPHTARFLTTLLGCTFRSTRRPCKTATPTDSDPGTAEQSC